MAPTDPDQQPPRITDLKAQMAARRERRAGRRSTEDPADDRRDGVPMKADLFADLLESVQQGAAILRGDDDERRE